jgi:hypothetical protein
MLYIGTTFERMQIEKDDLHDNTHCKLTKQDREYDVFCTLVCVAFAVLLLVASLPVCAANGRTVSESSSNASSRH